MRIGPLLGGIRRRIGSRRTVYLKLLYDDTAWTSMKTKPSERVYLFPWTGVTSFPDGESNEQAGTMTFRTYQGEYGEVPERVKGSKKRFNDARRDGHIYVTTDRRIKGNIDELKFEHSYNISNPGRPGGSGRIVDTIKNYWIEIPDIYDKLIDQKSELRKRTRYSREEMLTLAYASANDRGWDVLTDLAELPSTIQMGVDALKALRNPLKTLKSLDLASKKRKRDYDIVEELVQTRGGPRIRKRKQWFTYYEWEGKPTSLAELSAKAWMTYRYGIMPILYSLQDISGVINQKYTSKTVWKTTKKREETSFDDTSVIGSFGGNHAAARVPLIMRSDGKLIQRVFIKTKYNVGQLKSKQLGFNPVLTAWELVPFSFVADWLVHIGDMIMALTPTCYEERAITYSEHISCNIGYAHGPLPASHISGSYTTQVESASLKWDAVEDSYQRDVITDNVLEFITLPVGLETNWKRQLDAFALAYLLIKPDLSVLDSKLLRKRK